MNGVKIFGFILIILTVFGRGNTLYCAICGYEDCGNVNKTLVAECNFGLVAPTNVYLKKFYPELKIEPINKFNCFKAEVTTKETGKDEVKTQLKGCIYANIELCKLGSPKNVPDLTDFACNQCDSDKCNGASALTQSAIFLTISFLFVLLSQKL